MSINIVHINKADLLLELYKRAAPYRPNGEKSIMADMFAAAAKPPTAENAAREIALRDRTGDFNFNIVDLGEGPKELLVHLSASELNPTSFDSLYGEGAALSCVKQCMPARISLFQRAPVVKQPIEEIDSRQWQRVLKTRL